MQSAAAHTVFLLNERIFIYFYCFRFVLRVLPLFYNDFFLSFFLSLSIQWRWRESGNSPCTMLQIWLWPVIIKKYRKTAVPSWLEELEAALACAPYIQQFAMRNRCTFIHFISFFLLFSSSILFVPNVSMFNPSVCMRPNRHSRWLNGLIIYVFSFAILRLDGEQSECDDD